MAQPLTKERMAVLIQTAAAVYQVLEEGQSVQINIPLSSLVKPNGASPDVASIIFMRPTSSAILQTRSMPMPPPIMKGEDNAGN